MSHVFTIRPHISFVEALARQMWADADGDPLRLAEALVLLPTRRACRVLREAFLRVTDGKAALLPRMQPLGDVDEVELYFTGYGGRNTGDAITDIPPAIAPLRRQMLLTRLITQKDKTLPLDQAAQLAEALAGLLDQVQIEGRDFADLENLVTGDLAKHWQETVRFLEIVTAAWPKVLEAEGCLDPAERRNRILAMQAEAWRVSPPAFEVIAAGSTGSVPAVADLMAVIAGLPSGRVVLPGLDLDLDEDAWQAIEESHPQYGMKRWLEKVGVEREEVGVWGLPPTQPSPQGGRALSDPGIRYCPLLQEQAKALPPWGEGWVGGERHYRVRLLQEAMRPAEATGVWHALTAKDIPVGACERLERLELEHQQEEADVIALRLRAALEDHNKTAALVTPDRALAERVAAALRRWGIEANDSAGAPLTSLPVGSFLCEVLKAASPEASAVDYLSLLKHPLAACGLEPAVCRDYARQIEMAIWRGVRRADGWSGAVRALRGTGHGARGTRKEVLSWVEKVAGWFEHATVTWPMEVSVEDRVREHLKLAELVSGTDAVDGAARLWRGEVGEKAAEFFNEWLEAVRDFPPMSGDDYMRLVDSLLRSVVVRPSYGQHPRISILGPLEARLHHADLVILGGMNEGTWPPDPAIDPWLSRPMKRDFGLPLPERRVGLSAHDFVQLASAPEVLITSARRVEGVPTVPSRFLAQVEAVLEGVGHGIRGTGVTPHPNLPPKGGGDLLAPKKPWREWARMLDAPERVQACDPPEPCPPLEARPKTLSVTEIGTWLRNPYAIYARRVLKLEALDPIDADVTAAERGTMVHEALEKFLTLHKETWPPDPLQTLLSLGRDVFAPFNDRPQVAAFWWPRFEKIARWFVAYEQVRRLEGTRVLAVEGKGRVALTGGAFVLRGRADRIDKLPDGSCAIIDYKTGVVPSQKDVELGYEPQLPLLALMLEEGGFEGVEAMKAGQLSYWPLKGGREADEPQDVKGDLPVLIAQAKEKLEQLIAEFSKPLTAYKAVPRVRFAPAYNDYEHLSRFAEWGKAGGE